MSIYLHDIPLPEARKRLQVALQDAGLWQVLGSQEIQLDENADVKTVLNKLGIAEDQAKIVMVNGVIINDHKHKLKADDLLSIFPPVGGGDK